MPPLQHHLHCPQQCCSCSTGLSLLQFIVSVFIITYIYHKFIDLCCIVVTSLEMVTECENLIYPTLSAFTFPVTFHEKLH